MSPDAPAAKGEPEKGAKEAAAPPKKRRLLEYRKAEAENAADAEDAEEDPKSPKGRAFREANLERTLFRWYERRREGAPDVLKKAAMLARRQGAPEGFADGLDDGWVARWAAKYGVPADDPPGPAEVAGVKREPPEDERPPPPPPPDASDYTDDQVYTAFALRLDPRSLPDRSLEPEPGPEPAGGRVRLLAAANRSGRHRTRVLVVGGEWRPRCLRAVNTLSQPVVYAGGGGGALTRDLFAWWFHREFVPAALAVNSRGALLVVDRRADFAADECASACGRVRTTGAGAPDPLPVVAELRARYAMLLLHDLSLDQRPAPVARRLADFTLKDAFPMLHRAWLNVRPESFARCWSAEPGPEPPPLSLGRAASALQVEEDRMLLLELQWLAHDLGLEVTDDDLARWVAAEPPDAPPAVKPEPPEDEEDPPPPPPPAAADAADHLRRALAWMESEPVEPGLLMVVRDVMNMARQASKMGLGPAHPGAGLPFFCHNGDHLTQPPPAHMGIPPYQLDPKAAAARIFQLMTSNRILPPAHLQLEHVQRWKRLLSLAGQNVSGVGIPCGPMAE